MSKVVRGLTWAHSRGYLPLVAASQAYTDYHPEVDFEWEKVSLRDFGEGDLEALGASYDLLVIDYPFVGTIAAAGMIYALHEVFDAAFLDEQRHLHIGPSYESYSYDGADWAIPVDAATQVSASRPDLLEEAGLGKYPADWNEVIRLAKETGKVGQPLAPLAASGTFWTLCTTLGERPMQRTADLVGEEIGVRALTLMHELFEYLDPQCMSLNPIQLLGIMATSDRFMLAPSLYGYNNYSRRGFAPKPVTFRDVIGARAGAEPAATIGGAGLSISRSTELLDECVAFTQYLAGRQVQESICLLSGGQPSMASVWAWEEADALAGNFFSNVRTTMANAYVRPNYPGFTAAQSRMAETIRASLTSSMDPATTLARMNEQYRSSLA